jgi:hypothetical protein
MGGGDWHRLDERIEGLSTDIKALADQDPACERLMSVPGIGPIISSAMVAATGNGAASYMANLPRSPYLKKPEFQGLCIGWLRLFRKSRSENGPSA